MLDDDHTRSLPDRVRADCRRVMATPTHVAFDEAGLDRLADRLLVMPEPDDPPERLTGEPGADDATLTLVLALASINFGSGYHDVVRKRPGLSGARTMAANLRDYVSWTGPLTAGRLGSMTTVDTSQIFGQDLDGGALEELMSHFAIALVDLGRFLDDQGGSARAWLGGIEPDAAAVADSLTGMPYFRDVEQLDGRAVAFHKRAQLAAADLARAGVALTGLDRLTAFADNLVPHVLRVSGALTLDPLLAADIDAGRLLEPGGRAEIELRAAAVVGTDALVDRLARLGRRLPDMTVDAMLWTDGQRPEVKAVPRPRARSVFY